MIFKSEKRRKLLSAVSSVVLSGLICLPASATNENQNLGDRGDLNADGSITSEDIKILTNHLTTASPLTDAYTAQLSDINCDYVLNGVDLALMQQAMCSDTQPETISPKEITDDAFGDLSAFSKLMLGWYQESEIQIYEGGTQTFQLCSSQNAPALILIPHGETNDFLSEYCILEYVTAEGNNDISLKNGRPTALFSDGGLRVLHCDAELFDGQWGTEFKWCNYGKNYNSSNDRQRIIRLANEAEGGAFLHAGDVMDSQTSGFHWYDVSGRESLDIGVSVTVDDIADGICTVTISPN